MLYPKIGIRPTIDGRWGGVRESLEAQTMEMAKNAKALIEENLRYPDGTPVQCVIADSTIGGGAEAAACADKFTTENVVATLTVTRCWCYGSETFDMDPRTIKAVWGFNGTERPARCIWLLCWLHTLRRVCLPSPFMDTMYRKPPTPACPPMPPKKSCALPGVPLQQAG